MDGLTHSLIGLTAAKAGLERLSPGTTALCLIAANAPDSDIVVLIFAGRWPFLQHHRAITHSIVGTLALAVALPLIFYLADLLIARFRNRTRVIRLKGLLLVSVLVTFTHPLMDWTNNYGVRFLLPWNSRWFYGDLVFIVDPFLWITLGGAAFLLTSKTRTQRGIWLFLGLITSVLVLLSPVTRFELGNAALIRGLWLVALLMIVVLYRRQSGQHWGARIPIAALCAMVVYIGGLFAIHQVALVDARFEAAAVAGEHGEIASRIAAMPTLANPLRWSCVFETERATYRFELSLIGSHRRSKLVRYDKEEPSGNPALAQAIRDSRSQILLEFARFPVVRVTGEDCLTQTLVQFADLRYTEPGRERGTFSLTVPVECPVELGKGNNERE